MMDLPRILVASTKEGKAREIAEDIGAQRMSEQDDFVDYLWNIDNKYYTSQVLIRTVESVSFDFSVEEVSALIVYHDPQAEEIDQKLERLASFTVSLNTPEILIFSCSEISDISLRDKVLNWCLHNKFELVELEQTIDSESDLEDNSYGIERIIEALHAHTWPNIVFKDKSNMGNILEVNKIGEQFKKMRLTGDLSEKLRLEDMLDGIMGEQDADFGELFSQLRAMKEHAASLPMNERRIVAEQIVTAFWKAMGGDLLEIED